MKSVACAASSSRSWTAWASSSTASGIRPHGSTPCRGGLPLASVPAARDHVDDVDQHRRYERRMTLWLFVTYVLIAIVSAALVLYAAIGVGWRPRRKR